MGEGRLGRGRRIGIGIGRKKEGKGGERREKREPGGGIIHLDKRDVHQNNQRIRNTKRNPPHENKQRNKTNN